MRWIPLAGLLVALLLPTLVWSQEAEPSRGDGLPAGAICRLGSSRFRHGNRIMDLAFSPDGQTIYSTSLGENRVFAWEVRTGQQTRSFPFEKTVFALSAIGDGSRLAVVEGAFAVRIVEASTGRVIKTLRQPDNVQLPKLRADGESHVERFATVAGSKNGEAVVGLYRNSGKAVVWDVASGAERCSVSLDDRGIERMAIASSGKQLAVGGRKGKVALVDAQNGQIATSFAGFTDSVQLLAFSPDEKVLAACADEQGLRVWDVAGKERFHFAKAFDSMALAFSADSQTIALAYSDKEQAKKLALLDANTGKERLSVDCGERVESLAYSPDGKVIALGGDGNTIRFFDAATCKEKNAPVGHLGAMTTIGLSPDGRYLASCSVNDPLVRLWDTTTGTQIRQFEGNEVGVEEVQYSPNGKYIASAAKDRPIFIWEVATGRVVSKLEGHPSVGTHLRFSGDGTKIVTAAYGRVAAIWDTKTGRILQEFATPGNGISSIITFDDSGIWAVERSDIDEESASTSQIVIYDLLNGRTIQRFSGHSKMVNGIAVSRDRRTLASHSEDKTIRIWEVATGSERLRFVDPAEPSNWTGTQFVAIAGDGRAVITAGTVDPVTKVWELPSGKLINTLNGHRGMVGAIDLSVDNRKLVSGSQDTTCIVWDMTQVRPAPAKLEPPTEEQFKKHWQSLQSRDAAEAYRAMWSMVAGGDDSVRFLRANLQPVSLVENPDIERLVEDLDSAEYQVREKATAQLSGVVVSAESALRKALASTRSAEVRQRIRLILNQPRIRDVRVVEVLEYLNSKSAVSLLEELARGPEGSLIAREARLSMGRIGSLVPSNAVQPKIK